MVPRGALASWLPDELVAQFGRPHAVLDYRPRGADGGYALVVLRGHYADSSRGFEVQEWTERRLYSEEWEWELAHPDAPSFSLRGAEAKALFTALVSWYGRYLAEWP